MTVHHLHDEPVDRIEVAPGLAVLVFAEQLGAPLLPADLGFEHECKRWADPEEADGELVKCVAPRLTNHTVTGTRGHLTIRASILCPDCGLHGWVTDGEWVPA